MRKAIAMTLLLLIGVVGLSSCILSEMLTITPIDKQAVLWAAEAGVIDANDFLGKWPSLTLSRRLGQAVDSAYEVKILSLQHVIDKTELDYGILNEVTTRNTKIGEAREKIAWGETGLISMGLTALGFSGFTGLFGLMRKRPGDVTKTEFNNALEQAGVELKDRERQMLEIVLGVKEFLDAEPSEGDKLKLALKAKTNSDTRKKIAELKTL